MSIIISQIICSWPWTRLLFSVTLCAQFLEYYSVLKWLLFKLLVHETGTLLFHVSIILSAPLCNFVLLFMSNDIIECKLFTTLTLLMCKINSRIHICAIRNSRGNCLALGKLTYFSLWFILNRAFIVNLGDMLERWSNCLFK